MKRSSVGWMSLIISAILVPSLAFAQAAGTASSTASSVAATPPNPVAGLFAAIIFMGMYFAPGIVATLRKHSAVLAIWAVNLFFGWTIIGWIWALIWALGHTFNKSQQNIIVTQVNAPVESKQAASPLTPQQVSEQIEGLIALKDKGHLTEEEFGLRKAEVLKRMA
ncbi:MAG: superinfection immunity protein [Asticcacaulis sp.]|nr:superinfection immunity protein [Asticcacaulis sp.]